MIRNDCDETETLPIQLSLGSVRRFQDETQITNCKLAYAENQNQVHIEVESYPTYCLQLQSLQYGTNDSPFLQSIEYEWIEP